MTGKHTYARDVVETMNILKQDMIAPEILDYRIKGMPGTVQAFPLEQIAEQGWNALDGRMPLPLAVLKESALRNNADWMQRFCSRWGVSLAPHGKTTMSPKLFQRQLADGAWAITLSTAHQVRVACVHGIRRILIANQLADPGFLAVVFNALDADPALDILILVDSVQAVQLAEAHWKTHGHRRAVGVLVEVGAAGGRTGVRSLQEALQVAEAVRACPAMHLRGVEGFEGIFPGGPDEVLGAVDALLDGVSEAARLLDEHGCFDGLDEVILSAGGSAYFDRVVRHFKPVALSRPTRIVLRSGCYVTHDSRMYEALFRALSGRVPEQDRLSGGLEAALAVLARVQSRPEPGLALLTAGKRDLSYDIHLPVPTHVFRRAGQGRPEILTADCEIFALADQHAFMRIPAELPLAVGDVVMLGVSHPCTTFDKWRVLYGVDDAFNVVDAYATYF